MNRVDGYIDLCQVLGIPEGNYLDTPEEFEKLYNLISANHNVKIVKYKKRISLVFSFQYNNEIYYFKYDSSVDNYNELLADEILNDLEIEHISYDLARLGKIKGVISKNFKKDNVHYILGQNILKKYFDPSLDLLYRSKKISYRDYLHRIGNLQKYNTLEDIWVALESRYKERSDREAIVQKVMGKIVDMFIVDALLSQNDRHINNWMIMEYENGDVDLQPIFDNGKFLIKSPYEVETLLMVDDDSVFLDYNILRFNKISSSDFCNKIRDYIWVIEENNIEKILLRIERRTGHTIPIEQKDNIKLRFSIQLDFLKDILGLLDVKDEEIKR